MWNVFGLCTFFSWGRLWASISRKNEKRGNLKGFRPPKMASQKVSEVHTRFLVVREPYTITVGKKMSLRIFSLLLHIFTPSVSWTI